MIKIYLLSSAFYMFFIIKTSFLQAELKNTKILSLTVGETKELNLNYSGTLHLSKKGVVDLLFLTKKKWQITAHRQGFVILTYKHSSSQKDHKVHIFVEKKSTSPSKSKEYFFCAKGIMCNKTMTHIHGVSLDWFFFIKHKIGVKDI